MSLKMNYKQWLQFNIDTEEGLLLLDIERYGALSPEVRKRKEHLKELKDDR